MTGQTPVSASADDGLDSNYARGGAFGASLGFGTRQALLMIDFSRAYFEPESPLFAGVPQVLDAASSLLNWARERGMLVCHTQVLYDAQGLDGGVFYRKIPALASFRAGNPLAEFVSPLEPIAGEPVVTKQYASGFFGTSLASLLRAQAVDCVVIAGMSTSGCVRATAVDAIQSGFIPVVAGDACGDRHARPHEASLFDLNAKYADVMSVADLRAALQGAGAPR